MRYKAVLFDLDGTLLDTLEDISDSVNSVLSRRGLPNHDMESYRYFIGAGIEELAMRALPEDMQDEATIDEFVVAIREEYGGRWANKTRPYQGIPELLDTLTARGIKMAILSNKPDNLTGITVASLLSDWRFECVIGAAPDVPIKPDPSMALEIARRLDIPPGEFIYLGDGDTDMKAAVAAGMYPVGALWGFRTASELTASGAARLIDSPADLLELL